MSALLAYVDRGAPNTTTDSAINRPTSCCEFMPVSVLTRMADDLGAKQGTAGRATSISGLFAVVHETAHRHRRQQVPPSARTRGADRLDGRFAPIGRNGAELRCS